MPDDIRDVVAKLRRAFAQRHDIQVLYVLPRNTFLLVLIGQRVEGFWPYEAQDARN